MTPGNRSSIVGAIDCHAHVFCNANYPYADNPVYEPLPNRKGTVGTFLATLDAHGLTHGLVIGAQPYGSDNRCMLDAIAESRGRLKGIALVRTGIADRELTGLADRGVVGIRINLSTDGMTPLTERGANRLLRRIREMNWFVEVHCQGDELAEAAPLLQSAGVHVLIDHFGRPDPERGLDQPGFQALVEIGKTGRGAVKLSGPFRSSIDGPPYLDCDPFVAAAIEAFGLENCVWGSDWPYVLTDEPIDYGTVYGCLSRWLPDPQDRHMVLWESPKRLFGF